MKTTNPRQLKPPNKSSSLFSCVFFRQCTDSPLSPTPQHTSPPPLGPPSLQLPKGILSTQSHPPAPLPLNNVKPSDSESSSSSTSQSFTQWRFPPTFPATPHAPPPPPPPPPMPPSLPSSDLLELFHVAELHFTSSSQPDHLAALHMVERSLVPNPPSDSVVVPAAVMNGVIGCMKDKLAAKSATKVLLALCLAEGNRRVAVECGASACLVDALPDLDGAVAERALAVLDLICTIPEGAAEVRAHALVVPMLVAVMGRMEGRGKEYAISVLAAIYGGGDDQIMKVAPPEEVARAVRLAMQQGDCSARGKRKGAQLIKTLQENGQIDLTQ